MIGWDWMASVLDILSEQLYGVDTETYSIPEQGIYGLKSIQVANDKDSWFFTSDNFEQDDETIRYDICRKFFKWLERLDGHVTLAFFNLDFDFSQMVKWIVKESGYRYSEQDKERWKIARSWSILESDLNLYKVSINVRRGLTITMMDISNFLTSTTLNKACKEWIGKEKIALDSKEFAKSAPTEIERQYGTMDAKLTFELYKSLESNEVIEGPRYVTIAGRTIGHFKDYLKKKYACSFNEFCYLTKDKELVEKYNIEWESLLRESNRGGCCCAWHKGTFHDCIHADAVSHYPTQMVSDWIPFGNALYEKPVDHEYTTIVYPSGYLKLKDGKLPYIQWNSKGQCLAYHWITDYESGQYVEDCCLNGTHAFWADEWEIIKECYDFYDVDISKTVYILLTENVQLKSYITMLFEGKKNNKGTKRQYYKILMNSLYGKFLSNPKGKKVTYQNGIREIIEDNDRAMFYLPLGSWIAMRGRVRLFQLMLTLDPDDVLYCDTDSIIYKGNRDIPVDIGKELGQWEKEAVGIDVYIVGPKTYQEIRDGKTITKCAGINEDIRESIPFGELKEGDVYTVRRAMRDKESWAKNVKTVEFTVNTRAGILR